MLFLLTLQNKFSTISFYPNFLEKSRCFNAFADMDYKWRHSFFVMTSTRFRQKREENLFILIDGGIEYE